MDAYYQWSRFPGRVHYERSGDPATCKRHVLLLHGFGVGTFHYDARGEATGRVLRVRPWHRVGAARGRAIDRAVDAMGSADAARGYG